MSSCLGTQSTQMTPNYSSPAEAPNFGEVYDPLANNNNKDKVV